MLFNGPHPFRQCVIRLRPSFTIPVSKLDETFAAVSLSGVTSTTSYPIFKRNGGVASLFRRR